MHAGGVPPLRSAMSPLTKQVLRSLAVANAAHGACTQVRHLVAHKHEQQPRTVAELTDADRRHLESERRNRMLDITSKACLNMVKAISSHKVQ